MPFKASILQTKAPSSPRPPSRERSFVCSTCRTKKGFRSSDEASTSLLSPCYRRIHRNMTPSISLDQKYVLCVSEGTEIFVFATTESGWLFVSLSI